MRSSGGRDDADAVDDVRGEDRLTAPPGSVPRRRAEVLTLGDCSRHFVRQPSPPLLAGAILAAGVIRVLLGHFSWRDLVVVGGLIAVTPGVEWMIHVYLLHARPIK